MKRRRILCFAVIIASHSLFSKILNFNSCFFSVSFSSVAEWVASEQVHLLE